MDDILSYVFDTFQRLYTVYIYQQNMCHLNHIPLIAK